MRKPTICPGENKGADQLCSNCEADQRLCFRYTNSTVPILRKSEISIFYLFSVTVHVDLCRTCSKITLLVFSQGSSYISRHLAKIVQVSEHSVLWQNTVVPLKAVPTLRKIRYCLIQILLINYQEMVTCCFCCTV